MSAPKGTPLTAAECDQARTRGARAKCVGGPIDGLVLEVATQRITASRAGPDEDMSTALHYELRRVGEQLAYVHTPIDNAPEAGS